MSIWKRLLVFLAVFLLVLGAVCLPFRGVLPSWIATVRNSWYDRPYQLAAAGAENNYCAVRIEKKGDLLVRFFDPMNTKNSSKWTVSLPEEAVGGELCKLYPVGNDCVLLGVYEENVHYLSLYRIQEDGTVERLIREECIGDNVGARRRSMEISSITKQQEMLYFVLIAGDRYRVLSYTPEEGLTAEREVDRQGSLSAVAVTDAVYHGEGAEIELTFAGNGLYYLDGKEMTVGFADLAAESHDMRLMKLGEYIGDHQLTSISLTQDGGVLLLLDGHSMLLVKDNGLVDLSDELYTSRNDCIVRLIALLATTLILSFTVCMLLFGKSRGRAPLTVYWGIVSLSMFLLIGAIILIVMLVPLKKEVETTQKLEVVDDIADLALTGCSIGDEKLNDVLYSTLEETNGLDTSGLKVITAHQENGEWYLPSGVRAELDPGFSMGCLKKTEENNGIAAEKSADRFWYCMKQGDYGLLVSFCWKEGYVASRMGQVILMGLAVLAAATVVNLALISRDVKKISRGVECLASNQDWAKVQVSGGDEIEGIASTLNSLAADRREEDRRRERLISSYRRFVPEEILELLGKKSVLDVDQKTIASRYMAAMQVSFTFPASVYTNASNTRLMFESVNQVIERTASIVRQKGGVVFNYSYDGYDVVMERDPRQVISMAVAVRQDILAYNEQRALDALPAVEFRIAVDEGGVILGIVGDQAHLEPTTISDSFVTLHELISICGRVEANILCAESIISGVEGYASRYVGKCAVGNRSIRVYEVFDGDPYEVRKGKEVGLHQFSEGVLTLYSGEIVQAKRIFLDLVREIPQDGCARYYLYLADKLTEEEVLNGLYLNGRTEIKDDRT